MPVENDQIDIAIGLTNQFQGLRASSRLVELISAASIAAQRMSDRFAVRFTIVND